MTSKEIAKEMLKENMDIEDEMLQKYFVFFTIILRFKNNNQNCVKICRTIFLDFSSKKC